MPSRQAEAHFRARAPWLMGLLLADFPELSVLDAAAIAGNGGHESNGFTTLQETKPVVPGSRGGWGWFQWTGPRRRAFEAYCQRNGKDLRSDQANYDWLFVELKGAEGIKAIPRTVRAKRLEDKVKAFELAFLRAGVKHYASRTAWARIALDAWEKADRSEKGQPAMPEEKNVFKSKTLWFIVLMFLGMYSPAVAALLRPLVAPEIDEATLQQFAGILSNLFGSVGGVGAVLSRVTANTKLKLPKIKIES